MTLTDPDHSADDERWVLLGFSYLNRLVVVAHAERGDNIRLISARQATPAERRSYEQVD